MKWQVLEQVTLSNDFLNLVRKYTNLSDGHYLAQLLWQGNLKTEDQLKSFFDDQAYQCNSYLEFGTEILKAKNCLEKALIQGENIAVWGDFEPDGLAATSVLWEGLGHYFKQSEQLFYYVSNPRTNFHGLTISGIDQLASKNVKLIVTCNTGSSNFHEINYARSLEIDIVIIDSQILAENHPNVTAILNPLFFPESLSLSKFSAVGMAYKLMVCLADNWQKYRQFNPEILLDLVAIGLLADLVELKGDQRFLAKKAISSLPNSTRTGVKILLELCREKGDRPTDTSTGIASRINAVSRVYTDNNFSLELLTKNNLKNAGYLKDQVELANMRCKNLHETVIREVKKKLSRLDLSTTNIIVLSDNQWELSLLPLVTKKIVEEYGLPTILLSIMEVNQSLVAQGYGYSTNQINLLELLRSQSDLLINFSGYCCALRLTLLPQNISLFTNKINQKLRQQNLIFTPAREINMIVTVSDLVGDLLKEITYLEPFGMGDQIPKFLIKNCWFEKVKKNKIYDDNRWLYSKIRFSLRDDSTEHGFGGVWWCKKNEELPEQTRFDAILEKDIDFNRKEVQIRLLELKKPSNNLEYKTSNDNFMIDLRNSKNPAIASDVIIMDKTPLNWKEIEKKAKIAKKSRKKLALNYHYTQELTPIEVWHKLLGIAKYLADKQSTVNQDILAEKLGLSLTTLGLGLVILTKIGLISEIQENQLTFKRCESDNCKKLEEDLLDFLDLVGEEQFKKQYFTQVSVEIISENIKESI